jgi:hypothetical protein
MENNKPTPGEFLAKLRKLGIEDEVEFYFVPSPELRNRIARGGDPVLDKLPKAAKEMILSGRPHALYRPMVVKYIDGTLDKDNCYILDMGKIGVKNEHELMIKCLNRSKMVKP